MVEHSRFLLKTDVATIKGPLDLRPSVHSDIKQKTRSFLLLAAISHHVIQMVSDVYKKTKLYMKMDQTSVTADEL